jgi:hypothetical protein
MGVPTSREGHLRQTQAGLAEFEAHPGGPEMPLLLI